MLDGRLRDSVRVVEVGGEVVIHHQFFELALPRKWVEQTPEFRAILDRTIHVDDLQSLDRELRGVVEFLSAQDCFFRSRAKPAYSLREVKEIFEPIAVAWYADYYRHPVWNQLRRGELSLNGLVAWVIHNYNISRAAGKSGARCAVRFPRRELRAFFRGDVLEKYWHCDAFYFVRHPALSVSDREVKEYVPLPASLAFEQYTVLIAGSDWLTHLLISYFQESSIRFSADCQDFYGEVETAYALPGFFRNWTAHMGLDFNHGHADNFARIFDCVETLPHEMVVNSLAAAWFAFSFLYTALNQISAEASRSVELLLRNPVRGGRLDPVATSLSLSCLEVKSRNLASLAKELSAAGPSVAAPGDTGTIRSAFASALFEAMSYSEKHDEIIVLGKIIEDLTADPQAWSSESADPGEFTAATGMKPSVVAIASFLRTVAVEPRALLFLLRMAVALDCSWALPGNAALSRLDALLGECGLSQEATDRFATLGLQWAELLDWRAHDRDACPFSFEI